MRKTSGAVVCPGCGRLVDVNEPVCPYCGRTSPGMFGYGPALQRLLGAFNLSVAVIGGCVLLYVLSLIIDVRGIRMAGMFDMLSPSSNALLTLGMTGGFALARGWWWTLLTAVFLHGSLLHLLFNMVVTRQYLPHVVELYGSARAWVIFVVAGVAGFAVSILASPRWPTMGASGAIFGLLAALIVYGRRTRQHAVTQQLWVSAGMMFLFGFLMPNVNNWAHAGGFAGGFIASEALSFSGRRESRLLLLLAWGSALLVPAAFTLQLLTLSGMLPRR
jgi:rhomboid protease GluP